MYYFYIHHSTIHHTTDKQTLNLTNFKESENSTLVLFSLILKSITFSIFFSLFAVLFFYIFFLYLSINCGKWIFLRFSFSAQHKIDIKDFFPNQKNTHALFIKIFKKITLILNYFFNFYFLKIYIKNISFFHKIQV